MSYQKERKYFTENDAKSRIGMKVRLTREFRRIPIKTRGIVINVAGDTRGLYGVDVQWDRQGKTGIPAFTWFTLDEYETNLREIKTK